MSVGYQPFLIANPRVGMERDLEPWILPEDAYPDLEDCYLFRGRVKKKMGYDLLGRLNLEIPNVVYLPNNVTFTLLFTPPSITPGTVSFKIGAVTFMDNGVGGFFQTDGAVGSTINYVTGAVSLNLTLPIAPGTPVFYFPGLPVMGLRTLETLALNAEELIAFDMNFAYQFSNATNSFINFSTYKTTGTLFNWTGSNSDFFWTTNYANAFWATNFIPGFQSIPSATIAGAGDGIRWHDQTIGAPVNGWINFLPPISTTDFLMGCLIILPYKGFLVILNTWEGPNYAGRVNFPQRARWNRQLATPFYDANIPTGYQGGSSATTWLSTPGNGGFIDAPTSENIVSAEFVKDTLIVYFEFSTWQLRFTGVASAPFIWEKINTELGSVSTFSTVPFDKTTIAVGNVGIHACDSVNVVRIDQKIPSETFLIQNKNNGNKRVYGIRDFFRQLVYWTLPYTGNEFGPGEPGPTEIIFPNKSLVYNYVDQSFSYFNDSFTCFGYFQSRTDRLWSTTSTTWSAANFTWISPQSQSEFPSIVAGNQQGFVVIMMRTVANQDAFYIANAVPGVNVVTITSPNHNLGIDDFILVSTCSGIANFVGGIYKITNVIDLNNFEVDTTSTIPAPSGTFTGAGTFLVVSNINILTKRFNPWMQEAAQVRLGYIDFYFDRTDFGQVAVNLYLNEDTTIPVNAEICSTFPETTYVFNPDTPPFAQAKLWKRVYFEDISQLFQVQITLSDELMLSPFIRVSDITLHAMMPYFSKSGRLINV